MKIPALYIQIILLGYSLGVFGQETGNSGILMHKLESHFANHFNVKDDAVFLRIIHEPKQLPKQPFSIISQHGTRLGHQTLWLVEKVSSKKIPVTLEVSVDLLVLAATKKINRRGDLNSGSVKKIVKRIYKNADCYLTSMDELEGMRAIQIIRSGVGITQSMIRPKPDMHKGDDVLVQFTNGGLMIETNGKVKKDGQIGDETQVILTNTGKRVTGEIISHKLVRIELN